MTDHPTTDRLGRFTDDVGELVVRLAAMAPSPTLDELARAMGWVGRLHAGDLLVAVADMLGDELVAPLVHDAWSAGETPRTALEALMYRIGYHEDGVPATPPTGVVLYRAALPETARGACWTADVQQALEHAVYAARRDRVDPAAMRIYRAVVPGEHLLARITGRSEDEYPVCAGYRVVMEIEKVEVIELDDLDL